MSPARRTPQTALRDDRVPVRETAAARILPEPAAHRAFALLVALAAAALLVVLHPAAALAAAAAKAAGDDVPLDLGGEETGGQPVGPGGGSVARVIVGLLVVVAVIYGVTWILKQLKGGQRETASGHGLEQITAMPLQGGGALSLVRVGEELLLLGSGANGATTLRRYDENEARALGLWPDDEAPGDGPSSGGTTGGDVLSILGRTIVSARARTQRRPADAHPDGDGMTYAAPGAFTAPGTAPASTAFTAPGAGATTPAAPASAPAAGALRTRVSTLVERLRAMTVRG